MRTVSVHHPPPVFAVTPQTLVLVVGLMIPMAGVIGSYFNAQARMNNFAQALEAIEKRQSVADQRQSMADQRLQDRVERIDRHVSWLCNERRRDNQQAGISSSDQCRAE